MNGLELDAPGIGKRYVTVCHAAVRALAQVRRAYGGRKNLRNAFSGWDPYENYVFDLLRGASRYHSSASSFVVCMNHSLPKMTFRGPRENRSSDLSNMARSPRIPTILGWGNSLLVVLESHFSKCARSCRKMASAPPPTGSSWSERASRGAPLTNSCRAHA